MGPGVALVALGVGGAIAWNRPTWVFITVLGYATALLLGNIMLMPAIRELRISQDCAEVLRPNSTTKATPSPPAAMRNHRWYFMWASGDAQAAHRIAHAEFYSLSNRFANSGWIRRPTTSLGQKCAS